MDLEVFDIEHQMFESGQELSGLIADADFLDTLGSAIQLILKFQMFA